MQPFASRAYPEDLARLVWKRWAETPSPLGVVDVATAQQGALPGPELLERFFSVCYQAKWAPTCFRRPGSLPVCRATCVSAQTAA